LAGGKQLGLLIADATDVCDAVDRRDRSDGRYRAAFDQSRDAVPTQGHVVASGTVRGVQEADQQGLHTVQQFVCDDVARNHRGGVDRADRRVDRVGVQVEIGDGRAVIAADK